MCSLFESGIGPKLFNVEVLLRSEIVVTEVCSWGCGTPIQNTDAFVSYEFDRIRMQTQSSKMLCIGEIESVLCLQDDMAISHGGDV